jgi:23S rRNA pseudouridine1911/1915/1917 synthase
VSRREIQAAIASGIVTVNGRPGRKGSRVHPSDHIDVGTLLDAPAVPDDIDVPILYADSSVIGIDKPPGIPSTARRVRGRPSIAGYLLRCFPDLADAGPSVLDAGLVNRLDAGTSGILLAARSRAAWQNIRAQFRRRTVRKEYLALVEGHLSTACQLSHEMAHHPHVRGRMVIVALPESPPTRNRQRRWRALAAVVPVGFASRTTLVRVELHTGITHQIRAQLAAIRHPVVGDQVYGRSSVAELQPARHLLHSSHLGFLHPIDHAPVSLSCPLPADFKVVLRRLGFKKKAIAGLF